MLTIQGKMNAIWRLSAVILVLVLVLGPAAAMGHAASPAALPFGASEFKIASTQTDGWRGEYYNNINLIGSPLVRNDAKIDFNWGAGSPMAGINADYFSVRWTRPIVTEAKTYRFNVRVDDGVRLWVDGQLLIDQWHDSSATTYSAERAMTAGAHTLRIEMYERAGDAVAIFWREEVGGASSWRGEYYNNKNLSGTPVLIRNDANLDFNWGTDAPAAGLPADNFSVRWTRTLPFSGGVTQFTVDIDDGVRLWVDNQLIIDRWHDAVATYVGQISLSPGNHTVRLEMFEHTGGARVRLRWSNAANFPDWKGEYYNNKNLSGTPVLVRNDANLDFNWGTDAPAAGLPADNFSVRWTRDMDFTKGTYRFFVNADDGVRLWVAGHLIIDRWHDGPGAYTGDIVLPKGRHQIRMEMYERTGNAVAQLWWTQNDGATSWNARFYNNRDLAGTPVFSRKVADINFDWGTGAPAPGVPADNFGIKFVRKTDFAAGTYRFCAKVDDGVSIEMDDSLPYILREWRHGGGAYCQDFYVKGGYHKLTVEYYDYVGPARIRFWMQRLTE